MVDYALGRCLVQYEGIVPETAAVRKKCGIFDVSHMGEILVTDGSGREFPGLALDQTCDRQGAGSDYLCHHVL